MPLANGSFLAQWADAFVHFLVLDESSPEKTCWGQPKNSASSLSESQLAAVVIINVNARKVKLFVRDRHILLSLMTAVVATLLV